MVPGPPDFADAAPKAEIHLHLEGSIDLDTLLAIRARRGDPAGEAERRRLGVLYRHRDFPDFLVHFRDLCADLRSPEDLALATTLLAQRLRRDKVRHAEVMCSVQIFARRGLPPGEIIDAVAGAADAAAAAGGPGMLFLFDGVRQWGPGAMEELVDLASAARRHRVIGIGMGGDEQAHDASVFAPAYAEARRRGLRTTVHAGEFAGPRSVWQAIDVLGADRVGHGIRALEDAALVRALAARRVPLECCPSSNLCTRVAASWEEHPVAALHRAGAFVTLSSDDPAMFGTTLGDEWRALAGRAHLGAAEVLRIGRRTIEAAFLDAGARAALLAEFDAATGGPGAAA
jgi:aminodeoxyfutalosine deaminase